LDDKIINKYKIMTMINRFEDLIAWQKARILTKKIYTVTKYDEFKKDFGMKDQIQRASVSIMSNIAEGFDRASNAEFHKYLVIAKGSCAEVKSQLYVSKDIGYISINSFNELKGLADELSLIIGGLRSAIQKKRDGQR
jgi:four helix bundle protein